MYSIRSPLVRTFAVLSLAALAVITIGQGWLLWTLLRTDLLDWERTVTSSTIRAAR